MALPSYNQFTTAEENLLRLLTQQATPNPPLGQEDFKVLVTKAVLNLFAPTGGSLTQAQADLLYASRTLLLSSYWTSAQTIEEIALAVGENTGLKAANNLTDLNDGAQALANIGGVERTPFLLSLLALTTGFVVNKADGTAVARTITASGGGVSVTNGDGNAANPTISLSTPLQGVDSAGSGVLAKRADGSMANRTIGVSGVGLTVVDGDGVGGNPTLELSAGLQALSGGGGAVDKSTPRLLVFGDSYTVAANKQVLFSLPIEVDGDMVIDGELIAT